MSAGNTLAEAQVQCLSEIFERAVKREIPEGEPIRIVYLFLPPLQRLLSNEKSKAAKFVFEMPARLGG